MEASLIRTVLRRVRAAARAAFPGRTVEYRIAINSAGVTTANTYLWDDDAEIVDYDYIADLMDSHAALFEPDKKGRIGLDLVAYNKRGDWIADKSVYVSADGGTFLDEELSRPIKQSIAPDHRKKAIQSLGMEVVEGCEQFLRVTVAELLIHPSVAASGIVVTAGESPRVVCSWAPRRTTSRGGFRGVSFAMHSSWRQSQGSLYKEYASYAKDPVIGSKEIHAPGEWFRLIAAHELAHWMQRSPSVRVPHSFGGLRKGHGKGFRAIYRVLRLALLDIEERGLHLRAS